MDNKKKKNIVIYSVIVCTLILVGFLGSYAYFINTPKVKNQEASVETGKLSLIFEDGNASINEALNFGSSIIKTFTIENNGSLDAIARMNWDDIINTYLDGSLTYTLEYSETEGGEYTTIIENRNVPRSETESKIALSDELEIPANTKYYYKLVITLNYLESTDQTSDLEAILSTHFTVEEVKTIMVTFNGVGVEPEVKNKRVELNSSYGELPSLERKGYQFLGWFTEETGGKEITSNSIVDTIQNHTLYAHWIESSNYTLKSLNLKTKSGSPTFSETATTDETANGLYTMADDYGTSYYFRGAVTNNYVRFAGFYWRIIRINGDGSLRIIYDGTRAYSNGTSSSARVAFSTSWDNTDHEDIKYLGYMYGGAQNVESTSTTQAQSNETSTNMKKRLESWYKTNIYDKNYDDFVSDTLFCNDRSIPSTSSFPNHSGIGYGYNETVFGAGNRFVYWKSFGDTIAKTNSTPILKCLNKNDAFTKSDTEKGNGKLEQKVGLITADEANAAGVVWLEDHTANYLFKGVTHYTMSPAFSWEDRYGLHIDKFVLQDDPYGLNNCGYSETRGVAPVISLTSEYVSRMKGTGTASDPFRVE